MRPASLRSERLIMANPKNLRLPRNTAGWDRIVATLTSPEFIALAMFCALGLMVTAALNLMFPYFREITASLQPFL
jgi:hypothetical protein